MFDFKDSVNELSIEIEAYTRKNGRLDTQTVEHVFRMPTAKELDEYRQLLTRFKGRKPRAQFTAAAQRLWDRCIQRVEGYEGLPEDWKKFFLTDDRAQVHIQSAVDELLEVATPTGELSKN